MHRDEWRGLWTGVVCGVVAAAFIVVFVIVAAIFIARHLEVFSGGSLWSDGDLGMLLLVVAAFAWAYYFPRC
jgi:hypothetical protein